MKKADMEFHYNVYQTCMNRARERERQGLFSEAMKSAFEAWDHVDGMMRYAHKYHEKEFESIEAINIVLKYAPLLFDFESMDTLEKMIKNQKRIDKKTNVSISDQLADTRRLMFQAHKLWNYLELNPEERQDKLSKSIGGDQDEWRRIAETWEKMGLLLRKQEGKFYRLNLQTRMGALTRGKCSRCGGHQEAPKSMFLELTKCPDCKEKVSFVILPIKE